jgi:membrane associated rhomboid family serine protease
MVQRRDYRRGKGKRVLRREPNFFQRISLTNLLIFVNVAVFIPLFLLLLASSESVIKYFAVNPGLVLDGYVWTLLTSMFMHGGFGHLVANMFSLFFIGNFVERLIGRKRFFWFYMIAGLVGGLFFVGFAYLGLSFSNGESLFGGIDDFAVGASGALFGLGGLLALLIPRLKVLFFFIIPMPIWFAMVLFMFGFWIASATADLPIGNTAHLGGLVVGVVYGLYLRKKYARKVKALNRMFG